MPLAPFLFGVALFVLDNVAVGERCHAVGQFYFGVPQAVAVNFEA